MKKFFDMLYFGGYYVDILHRKLFYLLFEPPIEKFILLLGHFSFVRRQAKKQGKTYEQLMKESFKFTKKHTEEDTVGFGHFFTGWLFGPMLFGFWGDILIAIYTIFGEDIGFYKFNKDTALYTCIFLVVAVFATLYLAFGSDERSRQVVKEYRKKPKKEQLKAFALFNIVYIIVIGVFIALFAYNVKQNGGW